MTTASRFEQDCTALVDACGEPVFAPEVCRVYVCFAIAANVFVFEFEDGSALLYECELYTGYPPVVHAYGSLSEVPDREVMFFLSGTPDADGAWRVARDDSGSLYVSFTERREYLDETVRWFGPDDEYAARLFAWRESLEG